MSERLVVILIFCCLLLGIEASALAENSKTSPAELKKEISRLEANIQHKENKYQKENKRIFEYDKQISEYLSKLRELESNQHSLKKSIAEAEKAKQQIQQNLAEARQAYVELARLYFMSFDNNYFKILLNQGNPEQAARNPVYFSYLRKAYSNSSNELKTQTEAQEKIRKLLQDKFEKLETLIAQQRQKAEELQQNRQQREQYLGELKQEIVDSRARKQELLRDQQRLQKLAEEIEAKSKKAKKSSSGMGFAKRKDGLLWPLEGRIIGSFGKSRFSGGVKWRGILIAAPNGSPVKAIAAGKVVFADWLSSYGYVVIIDHGNNYMSLYGHNQQLLKNVNDTVKANEIISEVGNSGRNGEPALYFEIRHEGQPVNPEKWLLARKYAK